MSKEEVVKIQTFVLKVNIHCDGCKQKVKKLLRKIEGVYSTVIDAEQGRVTVSGTIDPHTLIKKLQKKGKHAELWGSKSGSAQLNKQFQGMQVDSGGKNQKDGKVQKGSQQQPQQQQMKGLKDLKMMPQGKVKENMKAPPKDQKSVKFGLPEDHAIDGSDGDFDDDDDDEDGLDDEFGVDPDDLKAHLKMKALSSGQLNPAINNGKKVGEANLQGKSSTAEGKNGNATAGKNGNRGKNGGAHDGKNVPTPTKGANNGANGENNSNNIGANGGGGGSKKGGDGGKGVVGQGYQQMGGLGQMENQPMGHMPNVPAVQGPLAMHPAMTAGGYFQGAGPEMMPGNPYHQQYTAATAMMMQQQQRHNGMYAWPPMPPYPVAYMPPPHGPEPYSNYFSDENPIGCVIM